VGGGGGSGLKSEFFFSLIGEEKIGKYTGSGGFFKKFDLLHSGWFLLSCFHEDCLEFQRNLIPSSPTEIQKSRQDDNNARKLPV